VGVSTPHASTFTRAWAAGLEECKGRCLTHLQTCTAIGYNRVSQACEVHTSPAVAHTAAGTPCTCLLFKTAPPPPGAPPPPPTSPPSTPPPPLQPPTSPPAVRLILDTDMGCGACRDVDDVVALCALHALADNGEVELLAVVQDSAPPAGAGVISVVNHFYGRDHIPIGAYKGSGLTLAGEPPLTFVDSVLKAFPSPIRNASQVPDAVDVYRRVLAASPPRSVTIASVGLLTNLELLLRSGPDAHSPLDGYALVAEKVALLSIMAGDYATSGPRFAECNACGCFNGADAVSRATAAAASSFVAANVPPSVRTIYLGWRVGDVVRTGAVMELCAAPANPCRHALMDFRDRAGWGWGPGGRSSYDPLAALLAVRGVSREGVGLSECTQCDGVNSIDPKSGKNEWLPGRRSNQSYVELTDRMRAQEAIDALLCQPRPPPPPPPPHTPPPPQSGGESVLVRPGHLSEVAAAPPVPPVPPAHVAKGDTPSESATPSWEGLLARASRMAQSVGQSLAEALELDAASGVQRRLLGSVELSALLGAVAAGCCVACRHRRRRRRERRFDQLADEPDQPDHQELHGEGRSEAFGTERRKKEVPQRGDRVKHGRRGEGTVAELLPDGRSRIVFDEVEEHGEHRYIGQLEGAAPLDSPQRRQATRSHVEEAARRAKLEASAAAGRRVLKELQKEQARQQEAQQEAQTRQLLRAQELGRAAGRGAEL